MFVKNKAVDCLSNLLLMISELLLMYDFKCICCHLVNDFEMIFMHISVRGCLLSHDFVYKLCTLETIGRVTFLFVNINSYMLFAKDSNLYILF